MPDSDDTPPLDRDERADLKGWVPEDDDELHAWIEVLLGHDIPRVAVCPDHCAPFDVVADLYFERVANVVVLANRAGGKTLNAAILNYIESLHKAGVEIASVGAILKQAKKCYRYMKTFMREDIRTGIVDNSTMEHTEFTNGSRVEVLTGKTVEAVNSPHPNIATIDEYELMEWDVLLEAFMMPVETEHHRASIRLPSTRKKADGNVQKMVTDAKRRGFTVYSYCALEVTQQCTFEARPSCGPCKEIIKLDSQNREVSFYNICQERLRNARGYMAVDYLIGQFKLLDVDKFQAQMAPCSRPARGDTAFGEWDDLLHLKEIEFDPELPVGTGWDFGLDDPMVCLVIQWDAVGNIYIVDEIGSGRLAATPEQRERLVDDVALEAIRRYPELAVGTEHWCDPSGRQRSNVDGRSCLSELRRAGLRAKYRRKPSPARRIEAIKRKLKISPLTGHPSLFVAERCGYLADALRFAQWDRTVAGSRENYQHDEYSHPLDALGYFIDGRFPIAGGSVSVVGTSTVP